MIELSDSDILPLSLEHNFWTWSAQKHINPIPVKKAAGVYFWDVNGKKYLDFQLDGHVREYRAWKQESDPGDH